ncbi:hypothetical protein AaE_005653, partial [Aphanomyces astaci]
MSSKGEKKELEVLCRYVPRIVLSQYAHSRVALTEPATQSFTAVMALFDISGFSTLADRLTKEENVRPVIATETTKLSTSNGSIAKPIDVSRSASHRRISHASGGRIDSVHHLSQRSENEKRHNPNNSFSLKEKRPTMGANATNDVGLMRTGMAIEQLTKTLNQTLAPVIDIITQYNGDIIKFAGDAMIVMWQSDHIPLKTPTGGGAPTTSPPVDPGVLLFTAISCALQVLKALDTSQDFKQTHPPPPTTVSGGLGALKMHVGMGFSTVTGNHVGGLLNRWEFYVAGAATGQMSIAEADAHAGELVVSAESYRALVESSSVQPMHIMAEALPTGNYKITDLRSDANVKYTLPTLRLGRDLIPLVKSYVPGCIALSLGKGKIVINGMRSITAIFIKFTGILDIADATEQLHEVHRCLCAVQDAAYRVHATIRQFLIDDKGAVAIVVVGLPPFYHENNALHGIRMALYLKEKGVQASIGITSGPAFCGSIGSAVRAEYAVVGDVINLAARLMSMAQPGEILCDDTTHTATLTRFEFDKGTHVMVKGKGDFIEVFQVFHDAVGSTSTELTPPGDFFMPSDVYDVLITRIQEFGTRPGKRHSIIPAPPPPPVDTAQPGSPVTANRRPSTLFRTVTKSPSQLLAAMHKSSLKSLGLNSLNTTTTNTDVAPPVAVLPTPKSRSDGFSVSESQSHVDDGSEAEESSNTFIASTTDLNFGVGLQFVHAIVQSGRLAADLLPLLNVFIPHCFPETSHSLALAQNDERFMHEVTQLVVAILREANERHPILIAWDDCQWIDAASWDLLVHVLGVSPNITCIVGVRPDAPPPHVEFKKLEQVPHTLRFDLQNLSARDTSLFLSHFYGIAIMNSGNPGSTIALMQRLLELETIYIDLERGVVHVLKDIHDVDLEISLQTRAKVMHHFDHMNSTSQLAMRITSVAIDYIHFDALHYMLRSVFAFEYNNSFTNPPDTDLNHELLPASLSSQNASIFVQALIGMSHAETHGIVALDHHNETIRFTSDDMRLVVYNVMLPSQRETIHRVFALWFENEVPVHRIPRFQHCYHLAYHLSRAHMYNQAMHYFAKGTEEALLRGVSEFALMCLTSAGAVLLLMDTSHSRHAAPRGLRRTSSSRAMHGGGSDPDDMEVTLHQCKIEFLTGLVMVQKSDWTTA